ncbi:MAG TPA: DUF3631 domain-containing protein [Parvularculaceae bacterium]|nr:DUF3631 domain-containing protein [Parvularculaceae bacterium]
MNHSLLSNERDYLAPEYPRDDPEAAAKILSDVRDFIARFCIFPDEHALMAVTLWAAHAHMVDNFHTTPRLALLSPEPASGKTRVLEILALLVPGALNCFSASPASIFRILGSERLTLLVDECDTIFSRRGKADGNEDLRALLNAGYKTGAVVPRCVGPRHEVQQFKVYCATALAGLGDLPDTIMSRSIIIRMRRRVPNETVESYRSRIHERAGRYLRDRLEAWAAEEGEAIGAQYPKMPPGIIDRPAEVWEPLLAVADTAGGAWPKAARRACVSLCRAAEERPASLGIRLLSDLKIIFGTEAAMPTKTILERLRDPESSGLASDAPWGELHGEGLSALKLAKILGAYGVKSKKVKIGGKPLQGYRRESLWDAWQRYLPPVTANPESVEPVEPDKRDHLSAQSEEVPKVPAVLRLRVSERLRCTGGFVDGGVS